MANLNDLNAIHRLDPNGMLTNLVELPDQLEDGWHKALEFVLPSHYIKHSNILIAGSGSSVVVGEIVRDLLTPTAKVPILVYRDGLLPEFVDAKTLVIGVSYTGSNREMVAVVDQAGKRGAKLLGISTNGTLESLAHKYRTPFFKLSYGSKPRAAVGYFFSILLGLLTKLGHSEVKSEEMTQAIEELRESQQKLRPEQDLDNNLAKQIASRIGDRIPVVIGSLTNKGVAARLKQQLNLNSKTAAFADVLPEAIHNCLIGLELPKELTHKLFVILVQSVFADEVQKQYDRVVFEILERQRIEYESLLVGPQASQVSETLQLIQMGDYISYYLAILNDKNPETSVLSDIIEERLQQMI